LSKVYIDCSDNLLRERLCELDFINVVKLIFERLNLLGGVERITEYLLKFMEYPVIVKIIRDNVHN
jgi:hypothetical protein